MVTQLDGRTLKPTTSLARLIAGIYSFGDELTINWLRGDKQLTGKVKLDLEISESAFNRRYMNHNIPRTQLIQDGTFGRSSAIDAPEEEINDLLKNLETQEGE